MVLMLSIRILGTLSFRVLRVIDIFVRNISVSAHPLGNAAVVPPQIIQPIPLSISLLHFSDGVND